MTRNVNDCFYASPESFENHHQPPNFLFSFFFEQILTTARLALTADVRVRKVTHYTRPLVQFPMKWQWPRSRICCWQKNCGPLFPLGLVSTPATLSFLSFKLFLQSSDRLSKAELVRSPESAAVVQLAFADRFVLSFTCVLVPAVRSPSERCSAMHLLPR